MHHYTLRILESTGGHLRTLELGEMTEAAARAAAEEHLDGVQSTSHGGKVTLYTREGLERGHHEGVAVHGPEGTEWLN